MGAINRSPASRQDFKRPTKNFLFVAESPPGLGRRMETTWQTERYNKNSVPKRRHREKSIKVVTENSNESVFLHPERSVGDQVYWDIAIIMI